MSTRTTAWALRATLAAAASVAAAAAPNEKLVLVTVVADQSGAATGLTPGDFAVTEDKDTLQVVEAVPANDPLSIVLVVDTARPEGTAASTPELRRALSSFITTVQQRDPAARMALYQVANAATPVTDFTSSRADLDNGINTIAAGNPDGSAMLEGVAAAAKRLGTMPAPRRAIVCIGIGTEEGSGYTPKEVNDHLRKSGATLWVVSVQRASDPSLTSRDTVWTRSTADSGGLRLNTVQASRLDAQLTTVANSLASQYTLRVVRKKDGAVKELKGQTTKGAQVLFTHWMR